MICVSQCFRRSKNSNVGYNVSFCWCCSTKRLARRQHGAGHGGRVYWILSTRARKSLPSSSSLNSEIFRNPRGDEGSERETQIYLIQNLIPQSKPFNGAGNWKIIIGSLSQMYVLKININLSGSFGLCGFT